MVCINPRARRFEIILATSHRQHGHCCPYCGCNSLWAKSYFAWNRPENSPCSFCRGEAAEENGRDKKEGKRESR